MGVPFVQLGMHAGMGGTYLLPEAVGAAHARDLLLTGRIVDAEEALRLGLVSRVIEPESFRSEVLAAAEGVAGTAPIASRLTKLALADGGHADLESCLQWEALAQPMTLATADLQEGIRAAREKRRPSFEGR
jgi:enoyl-CoA hydratase